MTSEHNDETRSPEEREEEERREVHRRLALPLLIPAIAFLFAMLAIFGLSRIYLDLADFEAGDVNAATPLAIGVALAILGGAWYLASNPNVTRWQIASMAGVAIALLAGGSIWAAVHEEEEPEPAAAVEETPAEDGGPPAAGGIGVSLLDSFDIELTQEAAPPGSVTFAVTNDGAIGHNFRAIKTDLDPAALPTAGGAVEEDQLEVVASTSQDLAGGETEDVTEDLEPGNYVLICNIPGHYEAGMRVGFTVEEGAPPAPEGGEAPETEETPGADATEEPQETPEGETAEAEAIEVSLAEWEVNPATSSAPADGVTFAVTNDGAIPHNFRVAQTDLEPDALPTAGSEVDEAQLDIVASSEDFAAGETVELDAQLEPGGYVLFCNLPAHYTSGMHAAFTVE